MLKKDAKWEWTESCQRAFDDIKAVLASESILKLLDFVMPFEVFTDASDQAIGGVLMQEGHPMPTRVKSLRKSNRDTRPMRRR